MNDGWSLWRRSVLCMWGDLCPGAVDMNVKEDEMNYWKEAKAKLQGMVSDILSKCAGTRVNGRVASERTKTAYGQVLRMCFNQLHSLGFHLQNPRNLSEVHITALCRHWHKSGLRASTMQEYLSKMRVFVEDWLGKTGTVKSLWYYLPDVDPKLLVVKKVAAKSKSWSANGIDVKEMIRRADELDRRFGLMLRLMLAFGLRRKEVLLTMPWKADMVNKFVIYPGEAKGGRPRDIHIISAVQREMLDYVKSCIGKNEHLGWYETARSKKATLKYNVGRYNRLMAKLGITRKDANVTGHGLRAQYAENLALWLGISPPTLGGSKGQMPKDDRKVRKSQMSESLGHGREDATDSYCGSDGRTVKPDEVDKIRQNVEAALKYCHDRVATSVPVERLPDCMKLIFEMALIGIPMDPHEVQLLWEAHSRRHACNWVTPGNSNSEALEVAAISLLGRA